MSKSKFELIKKKHGHYASWAVWADEGEKPKSNISDLTVLDPSINEKLFDKLNPNYVMVGLNISRRSERPLGNFHDYHPQANDFKIRYAFKDTPYYGAYITDVIKDFEQKISSKVINYLNNNKKVEIENIKLFKQELKDLKVVNDLIIAFGNDVYNILVRNLSDEYKIVKIPHYSIRISKENYKKKVLELLK